MLQQEEPEDFVIATGEEQEARQERLDHVVIWGSGSPSREFLYVDDFADGPPRKLLGVTKLRSLGWEASTSLRSGLASTYEWFLEHLDSYRD